MIHLKTHQEITAMKEAGMILKKVVDEIIPTIDVGMTTKEIDQKAETLINKFGGYPSFKTVKGYSWSTCLPVNAQAVHTPPSAYRLKDGDVLTLDIGVQYQGFHTDYATSIQIGEGNKERTAFLKVGEETLDNAIALVKEGEYLGTIGQFVEETIKKNGYLVLKELTGHGIGKELHEDPFVLNYLEKPVAKTYRIRNGLTIAVEIIYSMSTEHIAYEQDNDWSIVTADNSLSACFEKTVAIEEGKTFILT